MKLFQVAIIVFLLICLWRIFQRAGKPGWYSIVPFYDIIVELEIIGRPWWWLLLLLIPLVNIGIIIIMAMELGKVFGKSGVWSFFLLFVLPIIGYPILAFSSAQYVRGSNTDSNPGAPAAPTPPAPSMTPPPVPPAA